MITSMIGTVVSKTRTLNALPSAEVELDPVMSMIGKASNYLDLCRHITLKGPAAVELELGDRVKLTLEKIA